MGKTSASYASTRPSTAARAAACGSCPTSRRRTGAARPGDDAQVRVPGSPARRREGRRHRRSGRGRRRARRPPAPLRRGRGSAPSRGGRMCPTPTWAPPAPISSACWRVSAFASPGGNTAGAAPATTPRRRSSKSARAAGRGGLAIWRGAGWRSRASARWVSRWPRCSCSPAREVVAISTRRGGLHDARGLDVQALPGPRGGRAVAAVGP